MFKKTIAIYSEIIKVPSSLNGYVAKKLYSGQ